MNDRVLKICALGGPAALGIACTGWLIAGVLPLPLGPSDSVSEVVEFYSGHNTRLLIGLVIAGLGVCAVFPLVAAISIRMMRMEGRTPILTFLQLVTGSATGLLLLLPMLMMTMIGFRPDRSPELTMTLNDFSWLLFLTPIGPFIIQMVGLGVAVLRDPTHVFPRWSGYLNFLVGFMFVPDILAFFFKTGPFAWNGIFVFWLALTAYAVWLVAMCVVVRRSVDTTTAADTAVAVAA
jgi:hypothetical protein